MPRGSNLEIESLRDMITEILDYLISQESNQGKKNTLRDFKVRLN